MTAAREVRPSTARLQKTYRTKRRRQTHAAPLIHEIISGDADAARSEAAVEICDRRLGSSCPQTWWP